jgi:CRP-like cAMP-binding protein
LDARAPALTANKLLAALPRDDFTLLQGTVASLAQNTALFNVDDEVKYVCFPLSGMVSLLVVLKSGNTIENATVGRERVLGAMAGLGLHRSLVRAVVQLPGVFARIPSAQFRNSAAASKAISKFSIRYNETLLSQARFTAACNISHAVEARFCRWLLQSRDRAESDTVPPNWETMKIRPPRLAPQEMLSVSCGLSSIPASRTTLTTRATSGKSGCSTGA